MLIRPNRATLVPSAALLSLALIAGCSDSDDDGPSATVEPPAPTDGDTGMDMDADMDMDTDMDADADTDTDMDGDGDGDENEEGELSSDDLVGTWATGCLLDDPEDPDSEYESATITFTADTFAFEGDSYRDAGCTESLGEAAAVSGGYELDDLVVTTEGLETTELDLTIPGEDGGDPVTVLALAYLANGSLFFANGDLGELEDLVDQPRPDTLELDEPFMLQP